MNINTVSFVFATILAGSSVNALSQSKALPVQAILESKISLNEETVVVGVLGFSKRCQFAIYSDPTQAILLNEKKSVEVKFVSDFIPPDVRTINDILGNYVIISGTKAIKEESIYIYDAKIIYPFQKKSAKIKHECASNDDFVTSMIEIFTDPQKNKTKTVRLSGFLGRFGESGIALYIDRASADAEIYTHAIIISDQDYLGAPFVREKLIFGKEVVATGRIIEGKIRGSSRFLMNDVKSIEIIQD